MSTQLDLAYEPTAHVRVSDPATSRHAAAHAARFAKSHATLILEALRARGPMTAHEVAAYCPLNYVQVDRRFVDLEKASLAKRTDQTRPTPTGGRATVWAAA